MDTIPAPARDMDSAPDGLRMKDAVSCAPAGRNEAQNKEKTKIAIFLFMIF